MRPRSALQELPFVEIAYLDLLNLSIFFLLETFAMSSVIWISDGDGDIDVVCVSPSPGIARKASTTNGPEMDAEALWAQVSTSETPQFKVSQLVIPPHQFRALWRR